MNVCHSYSYFQNTTARSLRFNFFQFLVNFPEKIVLFCEFLFNKFVFLPKIDKRFIKKFNIIFFQFLLFSFFHLGIGNNKFLVGVVGVSSRLSVSLREESCDPKLSLWDAIFFPIIFFEDSLDYFFLLSSFLWENKQFEIFFFGMESILLQEPKKNMVTIKKPFSW